MPKTDEPRICRICGADFLPHNSNQCYCGAECQRIGYHARSVRYNAELKRRIMVADSGIEIDLAQKHRRSKPIISLDEVARRAREAHMTYGKYVMKHNI